MRGLHIYCLYLLVANVVVAVPGDQEILDGIIVKDDETRSRFGTLKEESEANDIVSSIKDVVNHYSRIRRYQRALALVEVSKPPALPPPFYAFKLAPIEAGLLACYQDFNEAVYVLHLARDNLLKYLGLMDKEALAKHLDVWEAVFAMTSTLISWYAHSSSSTGEGVNFLMDWMVESGPYRSKMQLPASFQPELPMNPWPEWEEWEGLGMGRVRDVMLKYKDEMEAEIRVGEIESRFQFSHDTECLIDMKGGLEGVAYKRIIYREEDCRLDGVGDERGEREEERETRENGGQGDMEETHSLSICNALNEIKKEYGVLALSYNTLSEGAKTMGHFGSTNRDWQAVLPLSNPGCLKIVVHRSEVILKEGEITLFDDSFWTSYINICNDKIAGFIKADFQHPQFRP